MAYNIFQLVLDFQRDPSHFEELIGQEKPLPKDTGKLLEEVAGKVVPGADSDNPGDELFLATVFFVERVLFVSGGDLYRQLGLDQNAPQEQIRKHYHLLMHLFMLDREDMAANWSVEYADCINRAYSILRDPVKRRAYDAGLATQEVGVNGQVAHSEPSKSYANSIVSFAKNREQDQVGHRVDGEKGQRAYEQLSGGSVASSAVDPSGNVAAQPGAVRVTEENSFIADSIERAYGDIGAHIDPFDDGKEPHLDVRGFVSDRLHNGAHGGLEKIRAEDDSDQTVEGAYRRRSRGRSSSRTTIYLVAAIVVFGVVAAVYEYRKPADSLTAVIIPKPEIAVTSEITGDQQQLMTQRSEDTIVDVTEAEKKQTVGVGAAKVSDDTTVEPIFKEGNLRGVVTRNSTVENMQQQESQIVEKTAQPHQTVVADVTVKESQEGSAATMLIEGDDPLQPLHDQEVIESTTSNQAPVTIRQQIKDPVETVVDEGKDVNPVVKENDIVIVSQTKAPPLEKAEVFPPPVMGEINPEVKTPPPEPGTKTVVSLLPEPKQSRSVVEKTIALIPDEDLKKMMNIFVHSYEEGDLARLLSVFAQDARTNDRSNRDGIAEDYRDLFGMTEKRQFIFDDLKWTQKDEGRARGEGDFEVKLLLKGETSVTTVKGRVTIDVEKRGNDLLITRFFHSYK